MTTLELTGLRGHHPLGFLAACGLLRCCHEGSNFGSVKLAWLDKASRFTAVLHCAVTLDLTMLTQMLICRAKQQRKSPALTWSEKIDNREKFRETGHGLLQQTVSRDTPDALSFLAALASDIVPTKGDALHSTDFDLTSGNQSFLSSIRELAGEPKQQNSKPRSFTEIEVQKALFGPWQYQDDDHSLGWDPETQRLHALRGKLPAQDTAKRSVRTAVFLASQALPLFPCFAVNGKPQTTGFHRENGDDWFAWPIWRDPISLDTLRSLLAHPFNNDLRHRGVELVYRCRRVRTGGSEGNYQVFSQAEQRPWPRRKQRRPVRADSLSRR